MPKKTPGLKAQIKIAKGAQSQGPFAAVEDAIAAIQRGEMVIVVDDEDRENEGDLTMAAEKVTPEAINFMATYGRGLICLPMTGERLDKLEIPLMVTKNSTRFETAFCVPIEAKRGTSTGISAADRSATVRAAINPKTKPARPGAAGPHVSAARPRRRRAGARRPDRSGRRSRAHRRADPAGVICEIMNDDGTMARVPALTKFAKKHQLLMITIADLIRYRMRTEGLVNEGGRSRICRPSTGRSAFTATRA